MLDRFTAQKLAKELKIDIFTIYREYLQLLFLKYLYARKGSEKVYFKGGTAIRILFGSFRFSEDLDFTTSLTSLKLNQLIQETVKDLQAEIEIVSFKKGKSIKNSFTGRIFQDLDEFKFPLTIRLDFSIREKPLFIKNSYMESIFPIGTYPLITHLDAKEMLAEKIRALITRGRGRDIFDIWFLLTKKIPLELELVNKKMSIYKKKTSLPNILSRIKKMPDEDIKSDLKRFLPVSHRDMVNKMKDLALQKLTE